ncbi:AAA+ ATPase domain-containing protein [Cynara cardunculus var. scolymus]|uniref:AAA+ ATPase domain-containing protein n=1 Tax=Cynara cardunculus var. scolymus TaxID=59895 RepID=A0A118K0U9_CYNCS|nr:AAA+ ATPase domain-containing protein [Cynara cardunculus var. scolymus]
MSLVAFPTLIFLIIPGLIYGKYLLYLSKKSFHEYSKANSTVEQALASIKTVYSFTAEKTIVQKYSTILDRTTEMGLKQGIAKGLAVGSTGLSFAIWALIAWYGSRLVMYKGESGGRVYVAGLAFILGGLIDRIPEIDGQDSNGLVPDNIHGQIEFENIEFTYPSRPNCVILKDFNLKIEAGNTIALVGASGSGKSTAIALVQRFYNADRGIIRVDGLDIKKLQLRWLRAQMGLVSQEHALFGTSIKENIMFGKIDATMEERIAIARAIIKNPVILLLDEATIMSEGRVIEQGSHNDLIDDNTGHYARLVKLQRQFSSFNEHEQNTPVAARSSASRLSTSKSSPAMFDSPILLNDPQSLKSSNRPPPSFSRLLALNSPEWKQGLIGSLAAIIFGAVQPVYALTIGGMISAFFVTNHEEMNTRIKNYSIIFCSLSVISILVNLLQHYNFAYMGEQLTKRIRLKMLEKILTFETAWFDDEHNASGALCSRLSHEASMVKSLVADRMSLLIQTGSGVLIAMVMGLVVAWKLALIMIAVQPLTILCFYARKVMLSMMSANFIKCQNQSTQIAVEAVYNHRIVTSFGSLGIVLQIFDKAQDGPRREARKKAWLAGIGIDLAQGLTFICWALDFWYGGKLVDGGEISAGDVFKTFFILISTGKVIADAGSMTSDIAKGSTAVASDENGTNGVKLEKLSGGIEIKKVDFAYPGRPETLILQEFCLEVKAGTSIGLVGKSGCGKSTVIALVQRFYDTDRGTVKVDRVDIRMLNIEWYRKHMALVSQEPVLYSGTIRDNIIFGKLDASENELIEAAKAANAHTFISSLKDGYDTECGERGVQLSGGQKQRIAIARAIIRDPTILLLDEATSALDVQSEQVVQEALDRIMVGRTTVVVAHRLNTIRNLDSIAFVSEGKVVEQGTYNQLKNKKGAFFQLANLQKA